MAEVKRRGSNALWVTGATVGLISAAALYRRWKSRSGTADPDRVGYAPLATPKPIDTELWMVDDAIVASGLHLPIRMTVIRLLSGELMLHSPGRLTFNLRGRLDAMGTVAHLVAPTTAHWVHLPEWQRAYPGAKSWAVPGLRNRSQVRQAGVRIDEDLGENAPDAWSGQIDQGIIPGGLGFAEAYFFHRITRTLILCDLIQNLESDRLPLVTRWAAKIARGTQGTTANHVRAVLRLGGASARNAIQAMVAIAPERVIFAHGEIFATDGANRLRNSFAWMTREDDGGGAVK